MRVVNSLPQDPVSFWVPRLLKRWQGWSFTYHFFNSSEPVLRCTLTQCVTENSHMKHRIWLSKWDTSAKWQRSTRSKGTWSQFPLCKVASYARWAGSFTSLGLTSLSAKEKDGLYQSFSYSTDVLLKAGVSELKGWPRATGGKHLSLTSNGLS